MGKTSSSHGLTRITEKHPHARGEDAVGRDRKIEYIETPPRTWGRREDPCMPIHQKRNTPTHVGKTRRSLHADPSKEKHPHARGEDSRMGSKLCVQRETPPRTWGRRITAYSHIVYLGNTPTHVGKTRYGDGFKNNRRKHPHARGEDTTLMVACSPLPETPPRTWGRHLEFISFFPSYFQ